VLQAAVPLSEGACWSIGLTCTICGGTQEHSNDKSERVHLPCSAAKEERLRQRRASARSKRGLEPNASRNESNRRGRGVKLRNVQAVAGALLSGHSYGQYTEGAVLAGEAAVSDRTWERYAVSVWEAVETVTTGQLTGYLRRLCNAGARFGVAADGAWNKRREAKQHCLTLLHDDLPIHLICIEKPVVGEKESGEEYVVRAGNYDGSSKGMESAAWARMAEELDAIDPRLRNLVQAVCVDRDASVTSTITVTVAPLVCPFVLCSMASESTQGAASCRRHSRSRQLITTQGILRRM
jgi:hypothetical protein